jgi:hypothetical protein
MNVRNEERRAGFGPVIAAAVVAVASTAALYFFEITPLRNAQQSTVGMVTSAAATRAGAIVRPTDPATRLPETAQFMR